MARRTYDPDTLREPPWTGIFVWVAMIPVFTGSWSQGFYWPIFPIGAWGIALMTRYMEVNRHNDRVRARLAAADRALLPGTSVPALAAAPAAPAPVANNPLPGGASGEVPGPLVPPGLRPLADEVERLCRDLLASDRGQVAEGLEMGLREVIRLTHSRKQIGSIDDALAEARAEGEGFTTQAGKATDAEARETWRLSAEAAARRVEKIEALRAGDERAEARIASFRQLVKSLAVDMTRRDLAAMDETLTLSDLADQAHRVDREVEALHRTNDELRSLSTTRRAQGA